MPSILAGQKLTAAALNLAPTSYTPTLTATTTNPTLGTGSTQRGWYYRIGQLVVGEAFIQFGTSGTAAGSGTYIVSLPTAADTAFLAISNGVGLGSVVGEGILRDNSAASNSRPCAAWLDSSTSVRLNQAGNGVVNDTSPWAWAASDAISIQFSYIVA